METFATSKNGRIPMKKTLFSSLLSLSAGIFLLTAAAQADVLKIKPTHPDRYTVVKGDTLWDISGRFLNSLGNGQKFGKSIHKLTTLIGSIRVKLCNWFTSMANHSFAKRVVVLS